jgi:hypothetical protein
MAWARHGLCELAFRQLLDCLCAVSDGMVSVECRHTNFNSRVQI